MLDVPDVTAVGRGITLRRDFFPRELALDALEEILTGRWCGADGFKDIWRHREIPVNASCVESNFEGLCRGVIPDAGDVTGADRLALN